MNRPLRAVVLLPLALPCTAARATDSASALDGTPPLFLYSLTYGLPFVVYYLGIIVRYYAKFLRPSTVPPLKEQLVAGIVFSIFAVGPLLPSFRLAVSAPGGVDVLAYVFAAIVILQEGLVLHERALSTVKRLVRKPQPVERADDRNGGDSA